MRFPTKEDYNEFVEAFAYNLRYFNEWQRLHNGNEASFFIYGSYAEGRQEKPWSSDVDGGIILDSSVVMPKDAVLGIANSLQTALVKSPIKIQINFLDLQSSRDGRFLSLSTSYTKWIKEKGRTVVGSDYREELNGLDYKSEELRSAAYNLRSIRNGLLTSAYDIISNPDSFKRNARHAVQDLSKFPKKLLILADVNNGEPITDTAKTERELKSLFPSLDTTILEEVNVMLGKYGEPYLMLEDLDRALGWYIKSVHMLEMMIQAYIERFPSYSQRELNPPGMFK